MRTLSIPRPNTSILATALLASLLAALFLLGSSSPASAHDSLVSSDPEADSTVQTLPSELALTFSAALIDGEGATEIVVMDDSGTSVTDGDPTIDGAVVTQPLVAEADAGAYHVIWKVVSSDGHPTSGEFSFAVADSSIVATTTPSPEPSATPTALAPLGTATEAPEDPNMTSGFSISVPWIVAGAVIALIAVFLAIVLARRRRSSGAASDSHPSTDR